MTSFCFVHLWRGLFSWYCFTTGPCGDWTPFYPSASSRNQIIVSRSNRLRLQNHVIPSAALMALWWRYNGRRPLETPRVSLWACFLKNECFSELLLVGVGGGITSHSELSRRRDVFFVVVFFFFLRLQFCLDPRRTCLWKERSCIRQLLSPGNDEKPNFFFN